MTLSRSTLVYTALIAIGALAIAVAAPASQAATTRLVIVAAGVVAAWRILGRSRAVTASTPERFEHALTEAPREPVEISSLRSVETDLRMSAASAFGLEYRLKPAFCELARWQLLRNHGIDMDRAPEAAHRLVGDQLWQLMQSADSAPEFRTPGAGLAEVQAGLDRLERI